MSNDRSFPHDPRLLIVGIYIALGIAWILFSNHLMLLLASDPVQLTMLQTHKGWGFILITATLLFLLMGRYRRRDMNRLKALRERDERLQLVHTAAVIGVWELDLQTHQTVWSEESEALFGLTPGSFGGSQEAWLALIHPDDRASAQAAMEAWFAAPGPFSIEYRILHPSAEERWLLSQGNTTFDHKSQPLRLLGINIDITQRKRSEQHLRQASAVYESSRDGIIITDPQANIVSINPAASQICGYSEMELIGRNPSMLKSGRHSRKFFQQMWSAIVKAGGWSGEIWNRRRDGSVYPEWLRISTVHDTQGRVINYAGVFSDLTHLKRSEAELEHLATHDPLTGLPNRRLLNTRLLFAIKQAQRHDYGLALLLVDLDRFKDINDSFGLNTGDRVLQEMARRVVDCVGDENTVARHSGDELQVLIEEIREPRQAAKIAVQILDALRAPYETDDNHFFLTASIGISLYPDNGDTPELLIRNADTAVHRAKEQGSNQSEFYSESLSRSALERLSMETGLRMALTHHELELHYQPQLLLASDQLAGVEALVRWRHPERGLIPPDIFIPLAEQSGLIQEIGEWVLDDACRQMAVWRDAGLQIPRVAVNLSAHQLGRSDLIQAVTETLAKYALAPSMLELELTETAIMRNPEKAHQTLEALADLGIALAVDDFGTGYSSLAYLQRLRLHRLKIDKTFVHDLPHNQNNTAICRAIIAMADSLGMVTVAEGVEEASQHDFLQASSCLIGQGWLFAKAMPAAELENWIKQTSISKQNA
jgi:diguanylate cyclase (GGDEF)-like protein/PAS domain S-box-containing protein